ncbi:hypothetical protein IE53DRAFT_365182, partial [Violaceomyces palustris]
METGGRRRAEVEDAGARADEYNIQDNLDKPRSSIPGEMKDVDDDQDDSEDEGIKSPTLAENPLSKTMQIKDHVFYVTGGASGLGEATVRLLHQMGAYVTIMDLNYDAARDLSNELNSKTPPSQPRSLACKADVCSEEDVVKAIQDSDRAWPDIQVAGCVNCGGVGMAGKTIDQDGQPF